MINTKFYNSNRRLSLWMFTALFFAGMTSLVSCSKSDVNDTTASVMAVNSAQTSAPQDLYIDNNKINGSAIAYTQSTNYLTVGSGSHPAQFKTSTTATVNASFNVSFAPGSFYSIYYADDKTATIYQNDRTAPGSGSCRVRFINLSTAITSGFDFVSVSTKSNTIVSNLGYKAASAYNEVITPSIFTLSASGSASVLLNIPVNLQNGHIYTIVISGSTSASVAYTLVSEN